VLVSAVAGFVGAAATPSNDSLVVGLCFVFYAALSAIVLLMARRRDGPSMRIDPPAVDADGPWCDATGVHRFPCDVLDVENHPRPGAQGHL
jgi:hypothetical protein